MQCYLYYLEKYKVKRGN